MLDYRHCKKTLIIQILIRIPQHLIMMAPRKVKVPAQDLDLVQTGQYIILF
jgi:hypothetical protein